MSEGPSAELLRAMKNTPTAAVSEDKLQKLKNAVAEVRGLEALQEDQDRALKDTNTAIYDWKHVKLPDIMDEVGVTKIEIEADGNLPKVEAKAEAYYKANIQADWEEERRKAAFEWLDQNGHGDLIKTEVTLSFPREQRMFARMFALMLSNVPADALMRAAVEHGLIAAAGGNVDIFKAFLEAIEEPIRPAVTSKQNVPWTTLTSWLKDMVENHNTVPPLETLGATVGRVVKLKNKD